MRCSASARDRSRVRTRSGGQARAQARKPQLRAGGGRPGHRLDRPASRARPRTGRARAGGVDHRRLRRCGHLCRADRQGVRRVTGVCSTAKVDMVRLDRADHVIDYTREDFAQSERRYDLILDIGGNSSLARLRRALTPRNPHHHRGRRWRTVARRHRSPAPGDDTVPVCGPEVGDVRRKAEPQGPYPPQEAHRIRQAHTGHRQDLPARRGPRGHPVSGRRARSRESRRDRVRQTQRSIHRGAWSGVLGRWDEKADPPYAVP